MPSYSDFDKKVIIPNSLRNFGIEMEFSTEKEKILELLREDFFKPRSKLIYQENYCKSEDLKRWYLKRDATTESELTTPAINLRSKEYKKMHEILTLFNKKRVKVTENDGLHIHIDISDVQEGNMMVAWLLFEEDIIKMFPNNRSRQETARSYYTQSIPPAKRYIGKNTRTSHKCIGDYLVEYLGIGRGDKHRAISFRDYSEDGTIEIRIAEGTKCFRDIDTWLKICLSIVEYAKVMNVWDMMMIKINNRPTLLDMIDFKSKQIEKWIERRKLIYGR